jgi:Ser/Thr protein kinase RdoA (MazF antagonist)
MSWNDSLYKIKKSTVVDAVKTWDGDEKTIQLMSKGINLVYQFQSHGIKKYLRITHKNIRSYNELNAAMEYQRFLFENHASVCQPLKSINSNFIEKIEQEEHLFFSHVVNEVSGRIININSVDKKLLFNWGKRLGILHKISKNYIPKSGLNYISIFDLQKETASYLKLEDTSWGKIYNEINLWLAELEKNNDNFGITHGDHRDANVIWNGVNTTFIDFDEPIFHWFLADIVRPFILFYEKKGQTPWQLERFLEGYVSENNIGNINSKDLLYFTRLKALELFLWTKNNWDGDTMPGGNPQGEFLNSLQNILEY